MRSSPKQDSAERCGQFVAASPGVGKTHLAVALGVQAIAQGIGTYFITAHEVFLQLVSKRYEKGLSIILTSNKTFGEWGTIFGDQIIATAILDRLLHRSATVNIRGESYRLPEKRKAGLLASTSREVMPAR